jgi:hypothetical protein
MSRRKLKQYLESLSKTELESQVLELHDKLKEVKSFYKFVFNPNENKITEEAKFKISKEYFPPYGRKPKKRRSVAHKFIKEFIKLGVQPELIADVMLYNIEVAQVFNEQSTSTQESFYLSMLNSFKEATEFVQSHGLDADFNERINLVIENTYQQNWFNKAGFEALRLE